MLEVDLCRICFADGIRMYPLKQTRYHEIFEWYTEDAMDMNDELPYSVCYLCNTIVNKVYHFVKNMLATEIHLKEILRISPQLTYESVEMLKKGMISKPYNLSKIWLRNSNYIALDAFKGIMPPKSLRRYFDYPPIMIEYHKPYEHMKLEDIPEEQEPKEPEEIKEAETEETKNTETQKIKVAESQDKIGMETEHIKEVTREEIKHKESPRLKQKESSENSREKSLEDDDKQKAPQQKNQNLPELIDKYSDTNADKNEYANDDDGSISSGEDIRLVWSTDTEDESPNIPNTENNNDRFIENNDSSNPTSSLFFSKETKTPDSIDSFLLRAKKYIPPEEIAKSSNATTTKEAITSNIEKNHRKHISTEKYPQEKNVQSPEPVKFHNPNHQFIEERLPTEEKPREKRVKTLEPVKSYNPYLQFIEERIPFEEKRPTKRPIPLNQRKKTPEPEKYHDQDLELIEILPLTEAEQEEMRKQMEKDKYAPVPNAPLVTEKLTPASKKRCKPVLKSIKSTQVNELEKNVAASEPKKYINSFVDFVKEIGYDPIINKRNKIQKESNKFTVLKNTRKFKTSKKKSLIPAKPLENNHPNIEDLISDCKKRYSRASILRKTSVPIRMKCDTSQLAQELKNRAAFLRTELQSKKKDVNAGKGNEIAITQPAPDAENQPLIQEENLLEHSLLKSKENSDKSRPDIQIESPQDIIKVWHVVEYPVKSKHINKEFDELKDQDDQNKGQVTMRDQKLKDLNKIVIEDQVNSNDQMWSDQDDNTMDSQVDLAIKVLDESLKDDDRSLQNGDQDRMSKDQNNHTLIEKNAAPLQLEDVCIIIEEDEEQDKPKDQSDSSLVVQHVFTLKDHYLEDEGIPKEQYDQIIMLANQDDQIMEDGNVAVKIESVDEEFRASLEENHEKENASDTDTYIDEDIMDESEDDTTQFRNIKIEVEQNMQIDDDVSESELYLQGVNENATQNDQDGPSNSENADNQPNYNNIYGLNEQEHYLLQGATVNDNATQIDQNGIPSNSENLDLQPDYNEIHGLNEQEHYAIRKINQITLMPTVKLQRLPIGLTHRKTSTNKKDRDDEYYCCSHCDFKTTASVDMFKHQSVHDMKRKFICDICQHRFLTYYHLSRHKVIHDRTKFYCAYCDYKTTVKPKMERHQNEHLSTRFSCKKCEKRCRSASHLSRHNCNNKNSRECRICNKQFKYDASYWNHIKKHGEVIPDLAASYDCGVCFKVFVNKKQYVNHRRYGCGNKKTNYECKWCYKRFNNSSNRRKHMKLHEKYSEKAYDSEETNLENETANESKKEDGKLVCSLCTKSFSSEIELGRHAVDHIL